MNKNKRSVVVGLSILTAVLLSGCVSKTAEMKVYNKPVVSSVKKVRIDTRTNSVSKQKLKRVTYGKASWYGKKYNGKKTASGEIFNSNKRTAAHKTLPFNTMVKVTDMVSSRSEIVRINDRGPFSGNRIIDLSFASAKKIGLVKRGVTDVKIEIVGSNKKVNSRLLSLPISSKSCIGDECKVSIPLSLAKVKSQKDTKYNPTIESVYEENIVKVQPLNSNYSSRRSINVVDNDPYVSNPVDKYSQKVSVQVGAFRQYSGAEIYLRQYNMFGNQHKAVIKNGHKNAQPIYRVQIEGFESEIEARRFISKNRDSLNGAFLVRK